MVARFIDGLRQTNGLIAGAIALPWRQYAVRDAIGGALWTALWVSVGAFAGGNLDRVRALLHRYETPALVVAGLLLVSLSLVYVWRRRRRVTS